MQATKKKSKKRSREKLSNTVSYETNQDWEEYRYVSFWILHLRGDGDVEGEYWRLRNVNRGIK